MYILTAITQAGFMWNTSTYMPGTFASPRTLLYLQVFRLSPAKKIFQPTRHH